MLLEVLLELRYRFLANIRGLPITQSNPPERMTWPMEGKAVGVGLR